MSYDTGQPSAPFEAPEEASLSSVYAKVPSGPEKRRRQWSWFVFVLLVVALLGGEAWQIVKYRSQARSEASQLVTANRELSRDSQTIKSDMALIRSDSNTIEVDTFRIAKILDQQALANEVPPGGYSQFQTQLKDSLRASYGVNAGAVDCVLPSSWVPGDQFGCDVFSPSNSSIGSVTVTVQSTNPGQSASWEYQWYPS